MKIQKRILIAMELLLTGELKGFEPIQEDPYLEDEKASYKDGFEIGRNYAMGNWDHILTPSDRAAFWEHMEWSFWEGFRDGVKDYMLCMEVAISSNQVPF